MALFLQTEGYLFVRKRKESMNKKTNPRKEEGFWMLPKGIAKSSIHPNSKIIYAVLCSRYNKMNGYAWPSMDYIGDCVGLSKRQVIRHIKSLEKLKLVKVKRTNGVVNKYQPVSQPTLPQMSPTSDTHDTAPVTRVSPKETNKRLYKRTGKNDWNKCMKCGQTFIGSYDRHSYESH